ncbi:MAG TPA: nitroreductase family protein [Prolixibacteraceae bacterium]|nr:nitroreductase family protein [Prolixibacteraceae bacterium]
MNFEQLASARYSLRNYSSKPVEEEKLLQILEAARIAPSAVNYQPIKIYVIQSEEMLAAIKECYHRNWINAAPVILVVTGLHDIAWKRGSDGKDHTDIDVAIAIDHITLQASDLGFGTCWVCNFDTVKCREVLKLNPLEEPIALIPLGYPESESVPAHKRKSMDELVIRL